MKTFIINSVEVQAETIQDLNDSQRQQIAEDLLKHFTVYSMDTEVNYILQQSNEDDSAPFSHSDIVNDDPSGDIEINGEWHSLEEYERDEKLKHYEYLERKVDSIIDLVNDKLKDLHGDEYDTCYDRVEKLIELSSRFSDTVSDLENMDFENHPEVYTWFLAPEMCRFLKERGEIVLNNEYWGRQCYGQAICLDNVIQDLAFELNWS